MQIQPSSFAFTLVLGFLAAVPYSGIDINLPALAATGATLGVSPSEVGLTMSAFMLSLAVAPLIYGPVSDRFGRKPVLAFGVALFVFASLACALAQSLPVLLIRRFVQGVGAASTAMTFAIIRDLFNETTARAKIANVVVTINVVTVIAPTAGAALLTIGGWRSIYAIQAGDRRPSFAGRGAWICRERKDRSRQSPGAGGRDPKLCSCADASGFVRIHPGWRGRWGDGVCLCHRILAVLHWRGGIAAGPVWPDL